MSQKYEILEERDIWKADVEDRIRNVDSTMYALTKKYLDSISVRDTEQVMPVQIINIKTFLKENKYGYESLKEKLEEKGYIRKVSD